MNEWIVVIYAVVGLIFVLFTLIIGIWIIKKIFNQLRSNNAFGADIKSRLVGLGVAVILFPTVFPQIIGVFVSMFSSIINGGSSRIFENVGNIVAVCGEDNSGKDNSAACSGQISMMLLRSISSIMDGALQTLYQIPINRLILLLGVWAFVAYLFDHLQSQDDDDAQKKTNWVRKLFDNRNAVSVRNTVFFLILAAGAYLSIAAIAAIPKLQEKSVAFQEIGVEKLKLQLENSFSVFEKKYPAEIGSKDTFAKLEDFLKLVEVTEVPQAEISRIPDLRTPTPTPAANTVSSNTNTSANSAANTNGSANLGTNITGTNSTDNANSNPNDGKDIKPKLTQAAAKVSLPKNVYNAIKFIVDKGKQDYERAVQNYKTLLANGKDTQRTTKDSAVQNYETSNVTGKGDKERAKHFLDLNESYNQQANMLDQKLSECLISVQEMDNAWKTFADTLPSLSANQNTYDYISYQSASTLYERNFRAQENCQSVLPPLLKLPERKKLGEASELGIFGFVAGWLLKTESLPLALITGLIGFGLLGSACSTFIREQIAQIDETAKDRLAAQKPRGLLVSDLTAVIIRGVSAAIVVFLAVEGGLAIFAAGGGEPNPYVLLLTCLVAAVFSETIWSWTQSELIRRLKAEEKNEKIGDKENRAEDKPEKEPTDKEAIEKEKPQKPPANEILPAKVVPKDDPEDRKVKEEKADDEKPKDKGK